jgi:hypothetical protein
MIIDGEIKVMIIDGEIMQVMIIDVRSCRL